MILSRKKAKSQTDQWVFFPEYDSIGGDIYQMEKGASLEQIQDRASQLADCVAFNSAGSLKNHIEDPWNWTLWDDVHEEAAQADSGLYVRRTILKQYRYHDLEKLAHVLIQPSSSSDLKKAILELKSLCSSDRNQTVFLTTIDNGSGLRSFQSLSSTSDVELQQAIIEILRRTITRQTLKKVEDLNMVRPISRWMLDPRLSSSQEMAWDILMRLTEISKGSSQVIGEALPLLVSSLRQTDVRRSFGLCCIYNSSRHGECAITISQKEDLLKELVRLLDEGSTVEKDQMASIFWNLTLEKTTHKALLSVGVRESLEKFVRLKSKGQNAAQGALFCLNSLTSPSLDTDLKQSEDHVMISYNWGHQSLAMKLNQTLKAHKFKVWIDVDGMASNVLEAMANAVEQASVVLILMSPDYKQSQACRTEAEYAYTLKKTIIPLLVTPNYKPDGWLGAFLGMKLYFDFSDMSKFDEVYKRLQTEIERLKPCKPTTPQPNPASPTVPPFNSGQSSPRFYRTGRISSSANLPIITSSSNLTLTESPSVPALHLNLANGTEKSLSLSQNSNRNTSTPPSPKVVATPTEDLLPVDPLLWSQDHLKIWLKSFNLETYESALVEEELFEPQTLLDFAALLERLPFETSEKILTSLGLKTLGSRLRFVRALRDFKATF